MRWGDERWGTLRWGEERWGVVMWGAMMRGGWCNVRYVNDRESRLGKGRFIIYEMGAQHTQIKFFAPHLGGLSKKFHPLDGLSKIVRPLRDASKIWAPLWCAPHLINNEPSLRWWNEIMWGSMMWEEGAFCDIWRVDRGAVRLGKVHYLRDGGRHITGILITLANHLIYASFLHNILFGP